LPEKRGIVYIAFGQNYCDLAANTIEISRKHTELPITVITNIPDEKRSGKWLKIPDVSFLYLPYETNENRVVKTQLYKYTPYDITLYIDTDAIIQKPGIERVFEGLKTNHIVLQRHTRWEKFKKYYEIYRRAAKQFDCSLPLDIFIGGFFCFRKTVDVERFFDLWFEYWEDFGMGRDMPPLACAVQNSGINYSVVTKNEDKLFSFGIDSDCVAIHRVQKNDLAKFNIPAHKQNKPFDVNKRTDWTQVYFDFKENPWLEKKVNTQLADKRERKYILNYIPEIRNGSLDILDIGAGFGQFLLCCRRYGNKAIGILPPLTRYEGKIGINNSDSLEYELYSRDRIARNKLEMIEQDFYLSILEIKNPFQGRAFDVINCKHAINLIMRNHFTFPREMDKYKNDGLWIIDQALYDVYEKLFKLIDKMLKPEGIFCLSLLACKNIDAIMDVIKTTADKTGFKINATNNRLIIRINRK
jgi:SAM-dependent methyltransferase